MLVDPIFDSVRTQVYIDNGFPFPKQFLPGIYTGNLNDDFLVGTQNETFVSGDCANGVIDDPQDVLSITQSFIEASEGYCILCMKINKQDQPDKWGWRWNRWGSYYGKQKPTREYLYDEPLIETIWVYKVVRVPISRNLGKVNRIAVAV